MSIDFDPSKDYYKALGVAATATSDEIKKAYRKLAKQFHPDSTGGDKAKEARFKEISSAYDILGDAKTRKQYDAVRAGGTPVVVCEPVRSDADKVAFATAEFQAAGRRADPRAVRWRCGWHAPPASCRRSPPTCCDRHS